MKRLFVLLLPVLIYGEGLKELINVSTKQNDLLLSKELSKESKAKDLESKESGYFPTLDLGAFYKRDDEASPFQAGDVYSGFAKLSYNIYDGGKRSSNVDQAKEEFQSSSYESQATKKSMALQITQDFFNLKSLEAALESKVEAQKSLKAQLQRVERFYEARLLQKRI